MFGGGDDPFRDIESFFRKMSQLGGHFTTGGSSSFTRSFGNGGSFEAFGRGSFSPAATISDSGKAFNVELDVPGIAREDLKVTATTSKLCISGQRKPTLSLPSNNNNDHNNFFGFQNTAQQQQGSTTSQQQQFQQLFLDERPVGFFERCFTFPHKLDESNVSAQYNNGTLAISVPHSGGNSDLTKEISIR